MMNEMKDELSDFRKYVDKQCFDKRDYDLGVGLEASVNLGIQGVKNEFKVPFEIKFDWTKEVNFK